MRCSSLVCAAAVFTCTSGPLAESAAKEWGKLLRSCLHDRFTAVRNSAAQVSADRGYGRRFGLSDNAMASDRIMSHRGWTDFAKFARP